MSKWIYRKHCSSLQESMRTKQEFSTLYGLISYVSINNNCNINEINISIYDFRRDTRIDWDYTFVIAYKYKILGFCTYKIS